MTPTIYVGDHQHAKVVCSAFAEGCGGKLVPATSQLQPGPAAMWGILRGAGNRIKECELYGHPYFYIDHGYFSRGHYDGYYRVVFCDRHLRMPPDESDGNRWRALGLETLPWNDQGGKVMYLPISRHVAAFKGIDADKFDEKCLGRLRSQWGEVVAKSKNEGEIADHLNGIRLVVGYHSNALFEAARLGVRVLELGAGPFSRMEMGDFREFVFPWLADNQWTLEEMRSGKCWSDLMARYGDRLSEAA